MGAKIVFGSLNQTRLSAGAVGAAQACLDVVSKYSNYAMRILGATGYSTEYPVARI